MSVFVPVTIDSLPEYDNSYLMQRDSRYQRDIKKDFPWVDNKALELALSALTDVKFNQKDVTYMNRMGIWLPFLTGNEALDFIKYSNTRIVFDKLEGPNIHAQYDWRKNLIKINKKYENTNNYAEILAISEAIMHEAGHALDNDSRSSIQEELDCLASNVLTHQYYKNLYPNIFDNAKSDIIKDGVQLYSNLYFDKDPNKTALVKRIREKYGDLPLSDEKHPPSNLAKKIKLDVIA